MCLLPSAETVNLACDALLRQDKSNSNNEAAHILLKKYIYKFGQPRVQLFYVPTFVTQLTTLLPFQKLIYK